jgi:UDP-xylose/UDP-N-acetylglucosamine transporter B4
VSSVSTNLALTVRKALSLCWSVYYFGNGWNPQFAAGAGLVFAGSFLYALFNKRTSRGLGPQAKEKAS